MINFKNFKKIISGTLIAAYFVVFAAPMGLCASVIPEIQAGIEKPKLRASATPGPLKLEGDICISKKNPKITLSLRDSDVRQVLRMFADKAGLNIIFHSSIDGGTASSSSSSSAAGASNKVTLDLVNVPLNNAFKMVLQVCGLTYYMDGNTMIVASAEAAKTLNLAKQDLMVIPVKYVDANSMADFLNKNIFSINKPGLSNSEIAVTNPSANEILIFGTKNDFAMAKKVIAQFDVKPLDETFVVNHTTPKEMADLLCNVLFKDKSKTGTASTGTSSTSSGSASGTSLTIGESVVACQFGNTLTAGSLTSLNNTGLSISYFPQRGTLEVLGGTTEQMNLIKEFITKNDKKQPQAYLEVSIIELNEDGSRTFNNTWNVWWENMAFGFNSSGVATNPIYPTFFQGSGYSVVDPKAADPTKPLYTLSKFTGTPTITYTMNYLIKNGKGRVLANPRILITNGQTSTIDLTSDYVSKVSANTVTSTTGTTVTYDYTIGSDDGIKVELTPYISPDGYVTLNIKPDYATIKETLTGPSSNSAMAGLIVATLLNKRSLDLKNIRIKDGETLTIGGMIKETEQKNTVKFPVLGDLPGIGMFFRNTDNTKSRQELVIMITPKIIKESEDLVNNAGATL